MAQYQPPLGHLFAFKIKPSISGPEQGRSCLALLPLRPPRASEHTRKCDSEIRVNVVESEGDSEPGTRINLYA